MAIGDGSPDNWELFQFADATLVAPDTYDLSMRLRGQAGTDAISPATWPVESYVVLIDGALQQIDLPLSARDLARHYRIGPGTRAFDDPSYIHSVEAFSGIGLRPLSPAHLRARADSAGAVHVTWIRRTRIDGDSWSGVDVPLGESFERYLVRIVQAGSQEREVIVPLPSWTYSASAQAADGVTAPFEIHVAQLSTAFGPGPFRRTIFDV